MFYLHNALVSVREIVDLPHNTRQVVSKFPRFASDPDHSGRNCHGDPS